MIMGQAKIRFRFAFLLFTLLLISLTFSVSAHSGRTDSSGGHNSDSGYHYHHGHPAHDHYDMDGDGDKDCPYNFVDKTGENSGADKNGTSTISAKQGDEENVPAWVYWVFALQFIVALALFMINRSKKRDIEDMAHRHKIDIDQIKQSCDRQLTEKRATEEELHKLHSRVSDSKKEYEELREKRIHEEIELEKTKKIRSRIKNAPLDITFTQNGMPIYWKPNVEKPYGDYTVYVNKKTHIYHVDRFCAPYFASEVHIFHVIEHNRPCRKCAEGFFDFKTVPEWFFMEDTQQEDI